MECSNTEPTLEAKIQQGRELIIQAPQLFISVDIEADGIAGRGSILEIAGVSPDGQSIFSSLVFPKNQLFIPEYQQFCDNHGLSRDQLRDAPRSPVVIREFADWVESLCKMYQKEAVFTGFNAGYDKALFDLYCIELGIQNPFVTSPLDIKSMVFGLLGSPWGWDATKKSSLPDNLKPERKFSHQALDDAKYQLEILCLIAYESTNLN
ncbi:hypothetical protein KC853_01740 [Candidatus Saccharibacteria bacterium]|nr:hypothetical protein [Candidatus Saccharibacteria bacterium]MCB9835065.1 hypothetical protein [Candidatus Nomurabacteria bacterium]